MLRHPGPKVLPKPWLAGLFMALALTHPGQPEAQTPQTSGQWGPKKEVGGTAVHLVLLPGGTSRYHSRIVWWANSTAYGMWGWRSFKDSCASWYDSNFVSQSIGAPPTGMNIFCGSNTILPDGRLFVAGGTDTGKTGITKSAIYNAETNSWTALNDMVHRRWYPTSTVLADGRVLTGGGNKYFHIYSLGGHPASSTTPVDSALLRLGTAPSGFWDASHSTTPSTNAKWPSPRTGAAAHEGDFEQNYYFGGMDRNGAYLNDTWSFKREINYQGDDYEYAWTALSLASGTLPPSGRRDHAMIRIGIDRFLSIGGRKSGGPTDEVYLLRKSGLNTWVWELQSISGTGPSARYGHAAILDEAHQRVLIYGGTETVGGAPSDTIVWALSYSTWSWSKPPMRTSASPGPRYGHRVALDPTKRTRGNNAIEYRAVLFGGKDENGALPQDTWALWFTNDAVDSVEWKQMTVTNTAPTGRFFHASAFDESRDLPTSVSRMVVAGGELSGGSIDSTVWILQMSSDSGDDYGAYWRQLSGAPLSGGRAGHTLLFPGFNTFFTHDPELYDPVAGTWSTQTSSRLLQQWYPQMFVAPGGSVFHAGPDFYSWNLASLGSSWSKTPSSLGPSLQSAVMYRPGKVMRAGTYGIPADSITQSIDLSNPTAWSASINKMFLRVEHNLVLLPNGRVMALGGSRGVRDNNKPIREPQIWDPDIASGSNVGYWLTTALAEDPAVRVYHSTAILLPDGRILSAGGDNHADQSTATVYCPPYLFKSDGSLATRPVVNGAPASMTWGKIFTVCVSDTANIKRVSLIRSGATTHGFDENQRYLELSFTKAAGRLLVTAPADSTQAPPGYYMLFVTGSADGADVPSIARWLRMKPAGQDTCDTIAGDQLSLQVDAEGTTEIYTYWSSTADDNSLAASGAAKEYDFRRKLTAIDSESNWNSATQISGEPTPAATGTNQTHTFTGLSQCTRYYLAARSRDDNTNLSSLHGEVYGTTVGTGCGSLIARADATLASLRGRAGAAPSDGVQSASTTPALVVETRRTATGGWRVVVRQEDDAATIGGVTSSRSVEVQDASGTSWSTSRTFDVAESQDVIGLCRIRDSGRTVLRSYALAEIVTRFRTADGSYEIPAAARPASTPTLADGDSAVFEYEPVTAVEGTGQRYLLASRTSGSQLRANESEPEIGGQDLPRVYALRQNQPNPFATVTHIAFDLPVASEAQLEIFDLQGRRVRTVVSGQHAAGRYLVEWDRRDDAGQSVRPGMYLYSLKAGSFRGKKTMVLLK